MKKTRKEPIFNIELDHHLRSFIMKRGYVIRGQRTRTLCNMSKAGPKSWLEAKLIPDSGEPVESTWGRAHRLAGQVNRELHTDVYVEPASKQGRYNEGVSEGQAESSAGAADQGEFLPPPARPSFGASLGLPQGGGFGVGTGVRSVFGLGSSAMPGGHGHGPMSHNDILPPQVREALGEKNGAEKTIHLKCPALYDLPGWSDLGRNQQKMFETEAAQLIHNGLKLAPHESAIEGTLSKVEMLMLQPNISRPLKGFLEQASSPKS